MTTPGGLVDKQELINAQLDTAHLGRVVNSKDASGNPIDTSTNRTGGVNKTLDALETEYLEAIRAAGGVSVGTWTAGVTTFTKYNEYAAYNGIPYKPRTTATLPYVAQGADPTVAPDDANVQPYQEVTRNALDSTFKAVERRVTGGGSKFYYGTGVLDDENYVINGDAVPSGTTHFAILISGVVRNVYMEPVSDGLVSGLSETDAVIGGTPVTLYPVGTEYKRDGGNIRTERNQVSGTRPYGSAAQRRDGYVLLRDVVGDSNCHGFADSTVIQPSDVGTYGAFDVTTTLRTAGVADHSYAYQCRNNFDGQGVGTLSNLGGVFVNMSAQDGTVGTVFGLKMSDVLKNNANVTNISGVDISNLTATDNAYGAHIFQNKTSALNSYSIFSDGDAPSYHKGSLVLGHSPTEVFPVTFTQTDGAVAGFGADNSAGAYFGTGQDINIGFYAAGQRRLSIENAGGGQLAVNPRANADTFLGVMGLSYNTVYLDTAPIITSDESHKTEITPLTDNLKKVGRELSENIGSYKMLNAVESKGDAARSHFGIGAQTLIGIFSKHNLNAFDFGVVCYEKWEDEYKDVQINEGEKLEKHVTVHRQKVREELRSETRFKLELRKGTYVKTEYEVEEIIEVPLFSEIPIVNEDGTPVVSDGVPETISVPEMEEVEVTVEEDAPPKYERVKVRSSGEQYSVRYDELYALILGSVTL